MTLDWAAIVAREGTALADAAAADPTAPIGVAPEWDTAELLRHVGLLHIRASVVLRTGTMERPTRENGMLPEPPAEGVVDWYRGVLAELVADIGGMGDPDRPSYAFAPAHQRAGFWPRRMAQETTVHRVDAETAVGRAVGPIEPALGADGIDEVFTVFVPSLGIGRSPGDGRTVHLHVTDTDGEWLIRFEPGDPVIETGPYQGRRRRAGPSRRHPPMAVGSAAARRPRGLRRPQRGRGLAPAHDVLGARLHRRWPHVGVEPGGER